LLVVSIHLLMSSAPALAPAPANPVPAAVPPGRTKHLLPTNANNDSIRLQPPHVVVRPSIGPFPRIPSGRRGCETYISPSLSSSSRRGGESRCRETLCSNTCQYHYLWYKLRYNLRHTHNVEDEDEGYALQRGSSLNKTPDYRCLWPVDGVSPGPSCFEKIYAF
jgi:hypothetical protein